MQFQAQNAMVYGESPKDAVRRSLQRTVAAIVQPTLVPTADGQIAFDADLYLYAAGSARLAGLCAAKADLAQSLRLARWRADGALVPAGRKEAIAVAANQGVLVEVDPAEAR